MIIPSWCFRATELVRLITIMVFNCGVTFQAAVVFIAFMASGADALCESGAPTVETAYAGAYQIRFPDSTAGTGPFQCRWLISAYRKDYVIHLQFDDVNLEKNSRDDCVDEISVYDGSETTDNVISTFCGTDQPRLITSSQTVLVVFSSNKTSIGNVTFKLKYKAFKDRHQSAETGQLLRIGFGSFVGAIACVVVVSWTYRKYKQQQLGRGVFIFGRGRHCGRRGRQNVDASARTEVPRVTRDRQASLQRQSFKNKVAGFFQDVAIMFSPRRMTVGSVRTESTDNVNSQQQNQPRQQQHTSGGNSQALSNGDNRNPGLGHVSNVPLSASLAPNSQVDAVNDHVTFGYPMIPLNSFTSDPDAVRPPTYEDCIKSVNPLYLHHHGRNMFYNMAFSLKDEESNCVPISSPPPPYTEISPEIPQGAWSQSAQEPPQYEANSSSSAATTPDQEATAYDPSAPEQCCERGETVICLSPAQERPIVLGNHVNTAMQLTGACICESFVAATIVQPIAILELPSNHSSVNSGAHPVESDATSAAPEIPGHVTLNNAPVVQASISVPLDLLRRSGLLPSHSTGILLPNGDNENWAIAGDTAIPHTDDPPCV